MNSKAAIKGKCCNRDEGALPETAARIGGQNAGKDRLAVLLLARDPYGSMRQEENSAGVKGTAPLLIGTFIDSQYRFDLIQGQSPEVTHVTSSVVPARSALNHYISKLEDSASWQSFAGG